MEATIRALAKIQQPDGSFVGSNGTENTFHASLIATCLSSCIDTNGSIQKIHARIASFLLKEKSPSGSWNYIPRKSQYSKTMRYPDDLDDTACALIALYTIQKSLVTGTDMAKFAKLLAISETKRGGPYRTWIYAHPKKPWDGIDVAVNANIASLLALHDVYLKNLSTFIHGHVATKTWTSDYYHRPLSTLYFASRLYEIEKSKNQPTCDATSGIQHILNLKQNGSWGSPLDDALAISSLMRLGAPYSSVTSLIQNLRRKKGHDNLWDNSPFYIEEKKAGTISYSGSRALTSAFVLEALALYEKARGHVITSPILKQREAVYQSADRHTKRILSQLPEPLKQHGFDAHTRFTIHGTDRVIYLLPYTFARSLKPNYRTRIKNWSRLCTELGCANMLGWMGYTIQDDIMDGDRGPELLPLSNILLRKSIEILKRRAPKKDQGFVDKIFESMDTANAEEIQGAGVAPHKRHLLFQKSYGHALGPLIITMGLGISSHTKQFKELQKFFEEYLIARQINDDAHDWQKDLDQGRKNYVYQGLIKAYGKRPISRKNLRLFFWKTYIDTVSQEIIRARTSAFRHFKKSDIADMSYAETLFAPLERAARSAITERDYLRDFLREKSKRR